MAWACDFGLGERSLGVLPPRHRSSLLSSALWALVCLEETIPQVDSTGMCTAARDSQLLDSAEVEQGFT